MYSTMNNMNYGYQDASLDISTAPPSSNYAQQSNQSYSSQFWGKPQSSTGNYMQQQQQQPQSISHGSGNTTLNNSSAGYPLDNSGLEFDRLKLQLKIKESQIESLETELNRVHETNESVRRRSNLEKVPRNVNEMFVQLSSKYEKSVKELEDTKQRLESLVTAITSNPSNNVTNQGRYDELEISHKILLKLETLKKENEALMKQLSFGKVKQMELELELLRDENMKLKAQLEK